MNHRTIFAIACIPLFALQVYVMLLTPLDFWPFSALLIALGSGGIALMVAAVVWAWEKVCKLYRQPHAPAQQTTS